MAKQTRTSTKDKIDRKRRKMIPYSCQSIDQDDIDAVTTVLKSTHLTQGKEVELFEEDICTYINCKHAVAFNSATSALLGAYAACGIGEGDEVITSPISFVATSNMLTALGAKPVWCDVKLDGNIDERFIKRLITPKTKAIVPVHFGGNPVNIHAINKIAKEYNLLVIEDGAHAFGSSIDGKKIGTFSDMSIFSFHAIKPITTGEGGCVVTDNAEFAKRLKLFRSHGIVKKKLYGFDMVMLGHNFRMTDFAAALGRSQLRRIESFINKREHIALYYDERFKGNRLFSTITIPKNVRSSRHLYPIVLIPQLQCPKQEIFEHLVNSGIGVQVHYKPIYQNSYYKEKFGDTHLHVSDDFYLSELSIPCHQKMSIDDAKFVADTLLQIVQKFSHRGCAF